MSTPPPTTPPGPAATSDPAPAAADRKAAGARKAAAVRKAAGVRKAADDRKAAPDPDAGLAGWGSHGGQGPGWPRRGAGRGIYDRGRQQRAEHWPLAARFNAWLFRHPEPILSLLGKQPPVVIDGRVLNRNTQAMLELVNRVQSLAFSSGPTFDAEVIRKQLLRMAVIAMPVRTDVHVTGRVIPASDSPEGSEGIPLRIYRRFGSGVGAGVGLGSRPPAIVYYHGGGWVSGDLRTHDASCRLLAAVSGCTVVAVDYRLAPEHPFPAAVDDAMAAYAWVHGQADELGIDGARIGVMGDSAGGNLAAVVALQSRDGEPTAVPGVPPPFAQGLIYPSVVLRIHPDSEALSNGFFLTLESMEQMRAAYVPDEADWDGPAASPMQTADLAGSPPALVVTAGFDPLHFDGDAYATKLAAAGVEVEHRRYDDQVHGFFGMGILSDALALSTEVSDAMGRMMHRSPAGGSSPDGA